MKKTFIWILSVLITLAVSSHQRRSGPTYPKRLILDHQGTEIPFTLPRSHSSSRPCPIRLDLPEPLYGKLIYRQYPTEMPWDTLDFTRSGGTLTADLPPQPPAGKIEYQVQVFNGDDVLLIPEAERTIIRFKGDVPAWLLIPHIVFIFAAMLLSSATGLMALAGSCGLRKWTGLTLALFVLGGLVLGPLVQKFAFGAFWSGWPVGRDLTDNKVLISSLFWLLAWIANRKKPRRWPVILAAIVMLAVFLIPHSKNGSELDYRTGRVETR
ncbi:hypothetical protein JW906_14995 [bacterium]|nr:hypothetical protein [bacterium]